MTTSSVEEASSSVEGVEGASSLDFPVVGLGASAGGVGPVDEFFEALPEDPGMAFVVILHLAPDRSSQLADVVAAHTELPTRQVTAETPVEINHVYVIPPGRNLSIREGRLYLSDIERTSRERMPIDHFLRSLARDQGPRAAGVIFSGTGSDGTLGLERIKEAGGLALAQTPETSDHGGMPRSAIGTGIVDAALPADQLGPKLVDCFRRGPGVETPTPDDLSEEDGRALEEILAAVHRGTDHDFSQYKRSTILRRIGRRVQINSTDSLPAYRDLVQQRPEEARKLAKEFLISVTQFFREPEAFAALEEAVLPELFAGRGGDEEVRVWVPGCATGEEVYSIAMLLREQARRLEASPEIQVFATDIDTEALRVARKGVYPRSIAEDLQGGRLERFFREEELGYAVTADVRNLVTFAEHNLLRDPPFSHLDLITCRNLLIYLNRQVQEKIFELFHYALRPEGYLFLGISESAAGASDVFSPIDQSCSIYQRRAVDSSRLEVPGLPLMDPGAGRPRAADTQDAAENHGLSALHQQLSAHRLAPPSVIIDEQYNIMHLAGGFGRYLTATDGAPSRNLLEQLPAGLYANVRQALGEAARGEGSRQVRRIRHATEGQIQTIRLTVEALEDPGGFFLVALDPIGAAPGEQTAAGADGAPDEGNDAVVQELEEELRRTREELRHTVEDYETSMEELKSSNEELQSMNEELQSTTEELETSKEEHQSINEELTTVNEELSHKIDELSRANSDLKNLMEATEIGIIFVDNNQCVQRFTRPATELFHLRPSDHGRPLYEVTHGLEIDDLSGEIERVIDGVETVRREVAGEDGRWYIMRIRPYRSVEDDVEGAVCTFVDITARKEAEEALRASEEKFRGLAENNLVGIALIQEGTFEYLNPRYAEIYGYEPEELLGTSHYELVHPDDRDRVREKIRLRLEGETEHAEYVFKGRTKEGETRFIEVYGSRVEYQGKPTILGTITDVTDRRRLQREILHIQEEERQRMGRDLHDGVAALLSGTKMLAGAAEAQARTEELELADQIAEIKERLGEAGEGIRQISRGLNPVGLEEGGLADALQRLTTNAGVSEEITCRFEAEEPLPELSSDVATHLYWVAQEAVNNARKYAEAGELEIRLGQDGSHLDLTVTDDGRGFDTQEVDPEGMGVRTMQYRADLLGGTLDIDTSPGKGTVVRCRIPVA